MASTSSSNIIQTSPSSTSSSSFSKPQQKHEVFLSFRGKDTRNNFTDHLYNALVDKGIVTFRDDEELEFGEPISSELLHAIETSRMAVVILSIDYASSSWCLEELAKIVECKKERGMRVLPVFYHLDPSFVQYQKGTFADAFAKHEERFKENIGMVQRWRAALREVAGLSGRHLKDESESTFIKSIVEKIFNELNDTNLSDNNYNKGLVGIDSRVEEIINVYMDVASDDVRFIGICGMSGIGKTTLADVVFERICGEFQASSFLRNVKTRKLVDLQCQLLLDMKLKTKRGEWDTREGINLTRNRLRNKKVLIVLDEVDEEEQLETLAGSCDWYGPGSRIIITTEDNQLLRKNNIGEENTYKARKLNASDALLLFSQVTFRKPYCEEEFSDLCNDFVSYAEGLPLALKVLGASLFGKRIELWKEARDRLKANPRRKIQDTLKISFDGLEDTEKILFLHIACFFKGEDKDRVADILQGSGCHPNIDIDTLIDKSLITILERKLWMHNLLQKMGWEIVRQESLEEPGGRSRLWLWEDVHHVLGKNTGTTAVEGIMLNMPPRKEEHLNAKAFSKMENLKLLQISNVQLPRGLSYLSNELHLMEWPEYPLKSMPESFQPDKLVELIMPRSHIKELPKGFSNLGRLKVIDLSDSQNLIKTPNFTGLANLERVIFQGCTRLHEVHPSIGILKRLTLLNLRNCKYLNCLPPDINLESLEIFNLSGCSRLNKFPEIGRSMRRLSKLYLDETAIEELPLSFEHLTSLKTLTLSGCKGSQPPKPWHSLGQSTHLNIFICAALFLLTYCSFSTKHPESEPIHFLLPKSLLGFSSLESLDLSDCNLLDGALPDDLGCLSSLQFLDLSRNNFTRLPDSISQLSKLKFLYLDYCTRLQSLPNLPLSTQCVMARECTSLENYSNQVIVWTSGETGFTYINCSSLGDDEECEVSKLYLQDIHFQPLWQRQLEELIDLNEGFQGVIRQTEISKWFSHQNDGSSVLVQLPPHLYENSSWRGIALCTVFIIDKNLNNEDSKCYHEFMCRLDIDGGVVDSPLVFTFPKDKFYPGSFGFWQYISHATFRDRLDVRGCISPSVTTNSPGVQIKLCGARILYEKDMVEFVQNFSQEVFGSHDDQRDSDQSDGYEAKSNRQTDFIRIIPRLERELKKLLSLLYQGDPARNHWYDYTFPQISIPKWFSDQIFLPDKRMLLPSDLHNNTTWTGFSVYVLYTVNKQPAGSCRDSTMFLRFSSDEAPSATYLAFPLSGDFSVESPRLLVFYIPRVLFRLNRCSEIWASFQSDNPSLKVRNSGIRLVYEQDVAEYVHTLVQCILRCPDEYREFYYRSLLAQVAQLQGCDHGKDFSCSFSSQRRPESVPILLPSTENVAEEGSTSLETSSNQVIVAGTSRNSSPSHGRLRIGIPILRGDQQYDSSTTSGILESRYKTDLQDYYNDGVIFYQCFPQSEIPRWFISQSDTPSVGIQLHPHMYYNPDWMGVALCAVFSFHKHPTAIHMNLGSGVRHTIMCNLETNLGRLTTLYYSIGEDDVLISLYQRFFIWVLFIPRGVLSHRYWRQSTCAKFSFVSDSSHVSALKCGVGLIDRQNMEEFIRTIVQLISSDIGYVKEKIRSSSKEGTVYGRLPIYNIGGNDDPRRQNDNVSPIILEEDTSAGAAQYSQEDPDPRSRFYKTGPLDFNPSLYYNYCFPPSKVAQEWFSYQSEGHSVTIDIPPNLYNDNNWMGLALCASFSMDGDPKTNLDNLVSDIPHFLTSVAGLDDFLIACCTSRREIMWLTNLGRFIWISYVPGEQLKNMLCKCSRIEASFVSDWPGVTVQKCGLRLFYQHDQVDFEQKLKHCDALIFEYEESMSQFMSDQEKINEQNPDDELGLRPTGYSTKDFAIQIFERPVVDQAETDQLGKSDLLDFDGCSEFSLCLPPREILSWFSQYRSNGPSVTIDVPTNLYDDGGWMGLFLCAYFSFHEDQTEMLNSAISHQLICCLTSNVAGPEPELHVLGTTKEEFRRLYMKDEFLWLSYIPLGSLPDWLNQCTCLEASFFSDWPGLMVQKCGLRFFQMHDEEEFEQIIFRCNFVSKNLGFYPSRPILKIGKSGARYNHQHCTALFSETRDVIDQSTIPDEEMAKPFFSFPPMTADDEDSPQRSLFDDVNILFAVPDFHPSLLYYNCFPPSKVAQEWFSHLNCDGNSVTIDIPPNLYNDNNWMGLALYASFSMVGDPKIILAHVRSEIQHSLRCEIRMGVAGPVGPIFVCCTDKTETMWLCNLGQFIWISYIPVEPFKNMLRHYSRIEASFGSDWPGVMVQKCGFRHLYHHHQVEFEQKLKHCETLIFEYWESINQLTSTGQFEQNREVDKKNFVIQTFRTNDQAKTDGTEIDQLGKRDLLDFDGCSEYSLCFRPREILNWFRHRSNGPSVTIDVPADLYDDSGWMGLILCVYFSVHEDQTEMLDSAFSHQLICSLESGVAGPEPELHVRRTTKEELRELYIQDEFLWLSYIPLGSLPDWLNQCSSLEASFFSDWPGLMVQKCGLRFFNKQDEEGFERIIFRCSLVSKNRYFTQSAANVGDNVRPRRTSSSKEDFQNETSRRPIFKGESSTSGAKNQSNESNLPDFDPCIVYNSCFPPNYILDWFSYQSDEPQVTIRLPPNLYDDPTWMGLALCVFLSVQEHCTIPACSLICLLETAIDSLQPPHIYCLTKEDLMLLPLGGFIWLSYIPRGSFPNWLNQSSFIEASIASDHQGLTVQRCGFRLLYKNKEIEFKETIGQLSQTQDVIDQLTIANAKTVKPNNENKAAETSTSNSSDGPKLKDKGKGIVE